jgi:hypothetical protein
MRITAIVALAVLAAGCSKPAPPAPPPPAFNTTIPVHDLMEDVVEPNADVVWHASGAIVDFKGTHDLSPTTDAGWATVHNSAAVVAEAGNLLLIPGRARPGKTWTIKAEKLTELGLEAMRATDARDKDAMLRIGGELDDTCDGCHEVYVLGEPPKP